MGVCARKRVAFGEIVQSICKPKRFKRGKSVLSVLKGSKREKSRGPSSMCFNDSDEMFPILPQEDLRREYPRCLSSKGSANTEISDHESNCLRNEEHLFDDHSLDSRKPDTCNSWSEEQGMNRITTECFAADDQAQTSHDDPDFELFMTLMELEAKCLHDTAKTRKLFDQGSNHTMEIADEQMKDHDAYCFDPIRRYSMVLTTRPPPPRRYYVFQWLTFVEGALGKERKVRLAHSMS